MKGILIAAVLLVSFLAACTPTADSLGDRCLDMTGYSLHDGACINNRVSKQSLISVGVEYAQGTQAILVIENVVQEDCDECFTISYRYWDFGTKSEPKQAVLNPPLNENPLVEEVNWSQRIIDGDKDEHGCLIPAGYSWCEEKQKCLRTWEENCSANVDRIDKSKDMCNTDSDCKYIGIACACHTQEYINAIFDSGMSPARADLFPGCLKEDEVTCACEDSKCATLGKGQACSGSWNAGWSCPSGFACYVSTLCPNSNVETCDPPTGDFKCHKKCTSDDDCASGERCQKIWLWQGDYSKGEQFCLA